MTERLLTATYRLQFEESFTFADAEALVPYLAELGVSHVYASPIFRAQPGSRHGYDVVDHGAVSPALGGEEGLSRLVRRLHAAGLGLILDIVPNHAGIAGSGNAAWLELLEFGPHAPSARLFDVDWRRGALGLPILDGDAAGLIRSGDLAARVEAEAGRIVLALGDRVLPLRPRSVARLLAGLGDETTARAAAGWAALDRGPLTAETVAGRRTALATALADPAVAAALHTRLDDPALLAGLLDEQHYRLRPWRSAARSLGYRRFFDITDLVGLRVEDPAVFETVHRLPVGLVREGLADGLRVDHVDGLADPAGYCRALRAAIGPDATIHVEKILGAGEALRDWPVEGTTGYETLNLINGLFVDPAGYDALAGHLGGLGLDGAAEERVAAAKREILETSLGSELATLAALARGFLRRRGIGPLGRRGVARALVELIAALPVYRTYIEGRPAPEDVRLLREAAARARPRLGRLGRRALDGLVDGLLAVGGDRGAARLVRRLQQLSGPAMAKGWEDTELYRFVALAAVNEVGSHPGRPSVTAEAFHHAACHAAAVHPRALVPLATHDTKRGPDLRARLDLLSETAPAWIEQCRRWHERHAALRRDVAGAPAPDRVDEWLIYQTLLGAWPVDRARIDEYLTKALREAKRHTSWTRQDPAYEAAALDFAGALVEGEAGRTFRVELGQWLDRLERPARTVSLAQTVVQLTMPGVPDIYRGSEFWDHSLVDPDNRRPVDWAARRGGLALADIPELESDRTGVQKQRLIARLLRLRRVRPRLFLDGGYLRLAAVGADDIVAFARKTETEALVVAVPTRMLAADARVLIALPFHRWSLRAFAWGGPADVVDNALRLDRRQMPFVAVLDVLPD